MVPVYLDFEKGTATEFAAGMSLYEKQIAFLAGKGCDLISAEGGPVFMIPGYPRETAILKRWKQRYKIPVITSSSSQVDALHALKVKSFVGATYLPADQNVLFTKYFKQAGFNALSMNGIDAPFDKVQDVPSAQIADYIKSEFAKHPKADAVYMLGSGWRTTDIIDSLERELGVPVIHAIAARGWDIQKILGLHYPIKGYGKLLAELRHPAEFNQSVTDRERTDRPAGSSATAKSCAFLSQRTSTLPSGSIPRWSPRRKS